MNVLTFFWLYYFLNTMLMLTVIYVKKCVVKMNFEKKSFKRVNIYFLGYFSSFIRPGLEILKSSIYSGEQEKKTSYTHILQSSSLELLFFFHEMTHTNFSKKPRQKHMSRSRQQKCEKSI